MLGLELLVLSLEGGAVELVAVETCDVGVDGVVVVSLLALAVALLAVM